MKKVIKKVKKAQAGVTEPRYTLGIGREFNKKAIKKAISEGNPRNPPLVGTTSTPTKSGPKLMQTHSIDTTGYSAGKKEFPMITKSARDTTSGGSASLVGRDAVESTLKKPNTVKYFRQKAGGKVTKAKAGKQMLKRADGSVSQRGLWDNIRANKGSGKKPTAQMLRQEKKIKAQSKKK